MSKSVASRRGLEGKQDQRHVAYIFGKVGKFSFPLLTYPTCDDDLIRMMSHQRSKGEDFEFTK